MKHLSIAFLLLLIPLLTLAEERDARFTSSPIDSVVFARMKGKSYKDDCTIPLSDLRYLRVLHYDLDGNVCRGELVCNKAISNDLLEIFEALYNARYPIERMVLIDEYDADDERSMTDNNSSCFNFRTVAGTTTLSAHSRGMAIDINPLFNPYVKQSRGKTIVSPAAAGPYVNRAKSFHYKIDRQDLCYRLFIAHGFRWGGAWRSSKDYQHFEK
jgi:hypothetical protein